jgi:hypothetical protein
MDKRRWIKNYVMIIIMGSDLRGVEKETRREIRFVPPARLKKEKRNTCVITYSYVD